MCPYASGVALFFDAMFLPALKSRAVGYWPSHHAENMARGTPKSCVCSSGLCCFSPLGRPLCTRARGAGAAPPSPLGTLGQHCCYHPTLFPPLLPFLRRVSSCSSSARTIPLKRTYVRLRCHTYASLCVTQEKDDWIGAIGRAIVQASSTYQGDNNNGDSDSDDDYDYR